MPRTAQSVLLCAEAQIELKFLELIFWDSILIIRHFILDVVVLSFQFDVIFISLEQLDRSQAVSVLKIPPRSQLEQLLNYLLIKPIILLVLNVPSHRNMQHRLPLIVLGVDVGAETYQGLNVILLDAHDRVVQGGRPVVVCHVWIEVALCVSEEV